MEEVIILDDFDIPNLSYYIKIWADNYNPIGEIKNGAINLIFSVNGTFPNYKKIDISNQINNDF